MLRLIQNQWIWPSLTLTCLQAHVVALQELHKAMSRWICLFFISISKYLKQLTLISSRMQCHCLTKLETFSYCRRRLHVPSLYPYPYCRMDYHTPHKPYWSVRSVLATFDASDGHLVLVISPQLFYCSPPLTFIFLFLSDFTLPSVHHHIHMLFFSVTTSIWTLWVSQSWLLTAKRWTLLSQQL